MKPTIIQKNYRFNENDIKKLDKIAVSLEQEWGIDSELGVMKFLINYYLNNPKKIRADYEEPKEPEYDPEKNPVVVAYMNDLRNDNKSCPVCMASCDKCEHLKNGEALKKVIRILG